LHQDGVASENALHLARLSRTAALDFLCPTPQLSVSVGRFVHQDSGGSAGLSSLADKFLEAFTDEHTVVAFFANPSTRDTGCRLLERLLEDGERSREEGHHHPLLARTQEAFVSQVNFLASFEGGVLLLNDFVKCTREWKGTSSNVLHASIVACIPLHRSGDLWGEHILLLRSLLQCCDSSNALAILHAICACEDLVSGNLEGDEEAALLSYLHHPEGRKVCVHFFYLFSVATY
jgi:hypothetical protein